MADKNSDKKNLIEVKKANKTLQKLVDTWSLGIVTRKDESRFKQIDDYLQGLRLRNLNNEDLKKELSHANRLIHEYNFAKQRYNDRQEREYHDAFGVRPTFIIGVSITSILASLFFLSPNLTGNVIGNLTKSSTNILGGVLFVLGVFGMFLIKK